MSVGGFLLLRIVFSRYLYCSSYYLSCIVIRVISVYSVSIHVFFSFLHKSQYVSTSRVCVCVCARARASLACQKCKNLQKLCKTYKISKCCKVDEANLVSFLNRTSSIGS